MVGKFCLNLHTRTKYQYILSMVKIHSFVNVSLLNLKVNSSGYFV